MAEGPDCGSGVLAGLGSLSCATDRRSCGQDRRASLNATAPYLVNRDAPKEVDLVASQPGGDLIRHLEVNEATRVEVMLLAGSAVRLALELQRDAAETDDAA